uniref:Uncharacterized protein n=1 Tax=Arundo donax TaxID=35708 RepID=A0A0A9ARQ5_ARUDO
MTLRGPTKHGALPSKSLCVRTFYALLPDLCLQCQCTTSLLYIYRS